MGYSAKAVANYFLANYGHHKISPLRLQKLVYISHGWYLALRDRELVDDEYAEAWEFGPVFPSLYHEFKDFGAKPITRKAQDLVLSKKRFDFETVVPEIIHDDHDTQGFLSEVWLVYEKYTPPQLSALTHAPGTPWKKTRDKDPGKRNAAIPNDLIKAHYKEKAEAQG